MTLALCTPWPSSVTNRTVSGRVLRWSRVRPSKFWVMDTVWLASHRPTRAASSSTAAAWAADEQTGLVLGIRLTKVYPPAAAARLPVATSSLYSKPGVRQWTCRSTKAGRTVRPAASTTGSSGPASAARPRPTAWILPPLRYSSTSWPWTSTACWMSMADSSLSRSAPGAGKKKLFPKKGKSSTFTNRENTGCEKPGCKAHLQLVVPVGAQHGTHSPFLSAGLHPARRDRAFSDAPECLSGILS